VLEACSKCVFVFDFKVTSMDFLQLYYYVEVNVFNGISITGCGKGTSRLCVVSRCSCIDGGSGFLHFLLLFVSGDSGSDSGRECSGDDVGGKIQELIQERLMAELHV
jgi:hypothetical protein